MGPTGFSTKTLIEKCEAFFRHWMKNVGRLPLPFFIRALTSSASDTVLTLAFGLNRRPSGVSLLICTIADMSQTLHLTKLRARPVCARKEKVYLTF